MRLAIPCAALLALFGALSPAHARVPAEQRFEFDVLWSVFPELILANGTLRLDRTPETYRMALEARAKLTIPPIDWRGLFAVAGERGAERLEPERFERRSIRPSAEETVIVTWRNDPGATPTTAVERVPNSARVDRDPVNPEDVRDVVDPLSFMAQMLDHVERSNGADCDFTSTTWDGARLARLRTVTEEVVTAARIDCRVIYERIDGLRRDTPWRAQEDSTNRIVRFRRFGTVWRPEWLKIEGDFAGFRSTFTTRIRPVQEPRDG